MMTMTVSATPSIGAQQPRVLRQKGAMSAALILMVMAGLTHKTNTPLSLHSGLISMRMAGVTIPQEWMEMTVPDSMAHLQQIS